MIVTIAGCGALGSLLATRLIEGGITVQAFQRMGAQLEALREKGITIEGDRTGTTRKFRLAAVSDSPSELKPSRLIIVAVKSYGTEEISPVREILEEDGVVLTIQNGLGNPEKLVSVFGEEKIGAGVTTYGAYTKAPGVIGWGGDGFFMFGPWKRGLDMTWIEVLLKGAGLNASYVEDPRPAIWQKLTINAMVNTTSALTGMSNGEMRKNLHTLDIMKRICKETIVAAGRAGVQIEFDELWAMHMDNLERTAANKTSMLQDLQAARKTEIDTISGGVLKYAQDGEEFPYTRAVYALVKAIDASRGY